MPFQGAIETSGYKPQGDALGYVRHWAFSPSLLNQKLELIYNQQSEVYPLVAE